MQHFKIQTPQSKKKDHCYQEPLKYRKLCWLYVTQKTNPRGLDFGSLGVRQPNTTAQLRHLPHYCALEASKEHPCSFQISRFHCIISTSIDWRKFSTIKVNMEEIQASLTVASCSISCSHWYKGLVVVSVFMTQGVGGYCKSTGGTLGVTSADLVHIVFPQVEILTAKSIIKIIKKCTKI